MAQYYVFTGDNQAFFTPSASDFQPAPANADPSTLWTQAPDGTFTQVQGGAGWHLDPAKGLAFQVGPNGQKSYGSPYGMEPSSMGGTFVNQRWNPETGQYEGTPNWNTIGVLGAGAGIGLGALAASGAIGGAAAPIGGSTATGMGSIVPEGLSAGIGEGVGSTAIPVGEAAVLPTTAIPGTAGIAGGSIGAIAPGVAASGAVPAALVGAGAGSAGGGGGAAGSSILKSPTLWSSIIGAGTGVAGALINAHAQGEATDAQVAAAKQALDFQKQVYNERKAGLQPYAQEGSGAINRLGSLWGFNMTPPATNPTAAVPLNGQPLTGPAVGSRPNPAGGSLASLAGAPGAPNAQALVTVKAPTGEVKQVSPTEAAYYTSIGAQVVPQGAA